MGGNGSKRTKEKKVHESPLKDEPSQMHRHDVLHIPSGYQHNKLQNPSDNRPIELSWLQQNHTNDHHDRIHDHHHHRHRDEHRGRIPIAIKRWPKTNDQSKDQKPKSFIEEYIHQ